MYSFRIWCLLFKNFTLEVQNNICVGGLPVYSKSKSCLTCFCRGCKKISGWGNLERFLFGYVTTPTLHKNHGNTSDVLLLRRCCSSNSSFPCACMQLLNLHATATHNIVYLPVAFMCLDQIARIVEHLPEVYKH